MFNTSTPTYLNQPPCAKPITFDEAVEKRVRYVFDLFVLLDTIKRGDFDLTDTNDQGSFD